MRLSTPKSVRTVITDQPSSTAENQDTCSGSEQNSEHLTSIYAVLIVHANQRRPELQCENDSFRFAPSEAVPEQALGIAAEAVEKQEEEDAYERVYGGGYEQRPVDPRLRLSEKQAASENDHRLMNDEEGHDE